MTDTDAALPDRIRACRICTDRFAATQTAHIHATSDIVPAAQLQFRIPQQPSLDGNTVEVESEQARYGANAMQYQASLRFLEGKIKGLMTALTGN